MVRAVSNQTYIPSHFFHEGAAVLNLFRRVWNAVRSFFSKIAEIFIWFANSLWSATMGEPPFEPIITRDPTVRRAPEIKINPPVRTRVGFLQKAIDMARLKLDEERLEKFNDDLKNFMPDAILKALNASIRAVVFSSDEYFFPDYLIKKMDEIDDLRNYFLSRPIRKGSPWYKEPALEKEAKEFIYNTFDPNEIGQLNISESAKKVFRKIAELSQFLSRGNWRFNSAMQQIH